MKLILDSTKCTGCKICELACSAKHLGAFNPQKSHLKIIESETQDGKVKQLKSCTLCLSCISNCPLEAIASNGKWISVNREACAGCGQCVDACPEGIIFLDNDGKAAVPDFCEGNPYCTGWCPHQAITLEGGAA